jgi:hypothetical protein
MQDLSEALRRMLSYFNVRESLPGIISPSARQPVSLRNGL